MKLISLLKIIFLGFSFKIHTICFLINWFKSERERELKRQLKNAENNYFIGKIRTSAVSLSCFVEKR